MVKSRCMAQPAENRVRTGAAESVQIRGSAIAPIQPFFVFRAIFKLGSPEFMIARSDQVWKKFYSRGHMVCAVTTHQARIELHDFPFLTFNYERLLVHCMEAVLLKAGARRVQAQQTRSLVSGD